MKRIGWMAVVMAMFAVGCSTVPARVPAGAGLTPRVGKTATIAWDAPTNNTDGTVLDDLAGYKLFRGSASSNYTTVIDVGNVTNYTVSLPDPLTKWDSTNYAITYNQSSWKATLPLASYYSNAVWYFAATAYNTSTNESDYSEELRLQVASSSNLTYRAAWGLTWASATNAIPVTVSAAGVTIGGNKSAFPRTTLYVNYGILGGADFSYQILIQNQKPRSPTGITGK